MQVSIKKLVIYAAVGLSLGASIILAAVVLAIRPNVSRASLYSEHDLARFKAETEPVLACLREYKRTIGRYPESLEQLGSIDCGKTLKQPSLGVKTWGYRRDQYGGDDHFDLFVLHVDAQVGYEGYYYSSRYNSWFGDS